METQQPSHHVSVFMLHVSWSPSLRRVRTTLSSSGWRRDGPDSELLKRVSKDGDFFYHIEGLRRKERTSFDEEMDRRHAARSAPRAPKERSWEISESESTIAQPDVDLLTL